MDDYEASYSRIEKLSNAARNIKDCLICRICLDYFKEPVTIKCGHIFCRSCILKVTNNEQATCPFCNLKIQKRSIPKEGNITIQSCVDKFRELAEAIQSDSGINVFESCHNIKSTKESIPYREKPSTSRFERTSTHSEGSSSATNHKSLKSKDFGNRNKKRSTTKKKSETNTIQRYLSSGKLDDAPSHPIHSEEKVKNWLESVEPDIEVANVEENTIHSPNSHSNKGHIDSESENRPSTSKVYSNQIEKVSTESKFKETEMRLKKAEMIVKKKSSQNLPDGTILRTPNSVPATSHSDAYDWRRVKRVGKEMQVKTFRSLNVSIERVVLNDTVPCNSTTNESKNVSPESDTDISTLRANPKQNSSQKENNKNAIDEYKSKNHSIESTDSQKEEVASVSCMNQKQLNEIIGILPSTNNTSTPKKAGNTSNASAVESKIKQLSPLKVKPDDEASEAGSTKSRSMKRKLSLRMKIPSSSSSSAISQSQQNELPKNVSPEKSKSKLSLKLPAMTICESSEENSVQNLPCTSKEIGSSEPKNGKTCKFKKLGRIIKKRKHVPFLHLGSMIQRQKLNNASRDEQLVPSIIIKSNVSANIDYKSLIGSSVIQETEESVKIVTKPNTMKLISAQEDSQLKFLSTDSQQAKVNLGTDEINQTTKTDLPMDIDETLPRVSNIMKYEVEENKEDRTDVIPKLVSSVQNTDNCIDETNDEFESEVYVDIESHSDKNVRIQNPIVESEEKMQEDVISVSSHDSESANYNLTSTRKGKKKFIIDSNSESESSIQNVKKEKRKDSEREKSTSSSTSSLKRSPLKKKRTHSESSNDDDDDLKSILGKWCDNSEKEQIAKKPKINRIKESEDSSPEIDENPLVDNAVKELEMKKIQKDPPIDDIISQAKSVKQIQAASSTMMNMPSSLLSNDLFESNDHGPQPAIKREVNEVDISYARTPKRKNSKNADTSQNSFNATIVDSHQFDKNSTNNQSNSFDGSDKENSAVNQTCIRVSNIENVDVEGDIQNSSKEKSRVGMISNIENPHELYPVSDSLMNITQEQLALKKIEKDLLGADLSALPDVKMKEDCTTPRRKVTNLEVEKNIDHDSDSDIAATPVTKRRPRRYPGESQSPIKSDANMSDVVSPEKNINLIPAITPVRNTRSYPLCHSTPMINIPSPKSKSTRKNEKLVLVISGLPEESRKLVQTFVKKFNADYQNSFTNDVTHVIVETYPNTKAGKKTFKYIQGIGYKKYVVNIEWIIDCLKNNELMNEDDEKYDVLDTDILESGSKRSRSRTEDLFKDFAFFCHEPFTDLSISEFKSLLEHNGAVLVSSLDEIPSIKDKYKIIILGSENLSQDNLSILKKTGSAIVLFEWVVDSVSQYRMISLSPYLYEMDAEEVAALGFPQELLIEDETIEEEGESS